MIITLLFMQVAEEPDRFFELINEEQFKEAIRYSDNQIIHYLISNAILSYFSLDKKDFRVCFLKKSFKIRTRSLENGIKCDEKSYRISDFFTKKPRRGYMIDWIGLISEIKLKKIEKQRSVYSYYLKKYSAKLTLTSGEVIDK